MKRRLIRWLNTLKKEINKRDEIYKYGVDLSNYNNEGIRVALEMITYNLFLMNKQVQKSEEQIRDLIDWWLYENVDKVIHVNKKKYNVESSKSFIKFLLEV